MKEQLTQKILSGEIPESALTLKFKHAHAEFMASKKRHDEIKGEIPNLLTKMTGYAAQCDVLLDLIIDNQKPFDTQQ